MDNQSLLNALNVVLTHLNKTKISEIESIINAGEAYKILLDICQTLQSELNNENEQSGGDVDAV